MGKHEHRLASRHLCHQLSVGRRSARASATNVSIRATLLQAFTKNSDRHVNGRNNHSASLAYLTSTYPRDALRILPI